MPPKRTIKKIDNLTENAVESRTKKQIVKGKRTKKNVGTVETEDGANNVSSVIEAPQKRRGRPARKAQDPSKNVSAIKNKKSSVASKMNKDAAQIFSKEQEPIEKKTRGRPRKQNVNEVTQNGKEASPDNTQVKQSRKTKAEQSVSEEPPKKMLKRKRQDFSADGEVESQNAKTIYGFKANDINGQEVKLQKYKGNVCIIVNVASKCGHTKSNYEQFVQLFDKYSKEKGLRILAFPCNQFGKQEPGDSEKICEFAKKKNVKFDMFEKVEVNGQNAHPLWKFLKGQITGPKGSAIDWNFTKFIIDKKGNVVERCKPTVKPSQMVEILEKYW